jgi:hypothetical protein
MAFLSSTWKILCDRAYQYSKKTLWSPLEHEICIWGKCQMKRDRNLLTRNLEASSSIFVSKVNVSGLAVEMNL